jgi:uncharacterized Zn finger protein
MSWYEYPEYVSVAERRQRAEKELAKLRKAGRTVSPVRIEGKKIADSFWGVSWCTNLERYSDFATRLPRGRSYVRNGFVVDLQIGKGKVTAMVSGTDLYKVTVSITPVTGSRWKAICRDCAGSIDSLVELLQGRLAKGVMDRVCRQGDGLFPAPGEIKLSCNCPDWADMCKHVAAVLYGVGARLDASPQLLFVLRGVDQSELIAHAGQDLPLSKPTPAAGSVLADDDVAALFGLDMADGTAPGIPNPVGQPRISAKSKAAKKSKAATGSKAGARPPADCNARPSPKRVKVRSKRSAKSPARTKRALRRTMPSTRTSP